MIDITKKSLSKIFDNKCKPYYGLDIETEIMDALVQEITAEIDREILEKLRNLPLTYSQETLDDFDKFYD